MPFRGPPDICGSEENCPEPTSPTLWPLETQSSPPDFCSFQGPLFKVIGSNLLTSCLCPIHINPSMESNAFFIYHNQNVRIFHRTHAQVYKLPRQFYVLSLLLPLLFLTSLLSPSYPAPNFSPIIMQSSFPPSPLEAADLSRHFSSSTHRASI